MIKKNQRSTAHQGSIICIYRLRLRSGQRWWCTSPPLTVYHAAGISVRAPVFLLFDVVREGQLASLAKPALVSKPREGSFGGFEGGRSLRPAAGGCAVAREEGFSGAQRPEVEGEDERRKDEEE